MRRTQEIRLREDNLEDIVCCPGGAEVEGKGLKGDLDKTVEWQREMLEEGMTGFISYLGDEPRGFIEYMPAEKAPFPIEGPEAAVLMCYHWVRSGNEKEESHLDHEERLIELVLDDARERYAGIATLGWDHPVHFPTEMLQDLEFEMIDSEEHLSVMWHAFEEGAEKPSLVGPSFEPRDLSGESKLAVDSAHSNRCPYSINNSRKLRDVLEEVDKQRIEHIEHVIDTHEDAIKYSVSPWNWEWLYLNGEDVPMLFTKPEELKEIIEKSLEGLVSDR